MTPDQVASDVAARIAKADQDAFDSAAAFAGGRFSEYRNLQMQEVRKRLEDAGASAIERARVAATGDGGAVR